MDSYAAEHGWLKPDGKLRGFARLYVSMLNAERLALAYLRHHVRARLSWNSAVRFRRT
jgi:hypothetical protein